MRYMVEQGQLTGSEAEDGLVRVLQGQAVDEADFGADGPDAAGRGLVDGLADELGGAVQVGDLEGFHGTFGVDQDVDVGVAVAGRLDLGRGEAGVDGAMALPEDHPGVAQLFLGVAAQALEGIPDDHFVQGNTELEGGVAAQVLVGEEEDALGPLEGPLEDGGGVGGGADGAVVAAAEGLDAGDGVHVGDGDDAAVVAEDILQVVPRHLPRRPWGPYRPWSSRR